MKNVWRNRKDFEVDFFKSYRRSRLQRAKRIAAMGSAIIRGEAKRHKRSVPRRVVTALSILDDLNLDAILWLQALTTLMLDESSLPESSFKRAIIALLMRLTQDAMVVRNLIADGFDVQAKSLLRSIDEHIDAIYYVCLKPEVSDAFVAAQDERSANRFWYEHFRSARKFVNGAISQLFKDQASLSELQEFRIAERELLSTAHHPSYMAMTIPFLVPYKEVNVTRFMFGLPNEFSFRTGKLLFYILAELAMFIGFLNKDIEKIIQGKRRTTLQRLVRQGQLHLVTMLLHLVENWRAPVFDKSREMREFVKQLER